MDLTELALKEPVYVTRPALPPLEDYVEALERIWASGRLTNKGDYHKLFEAELARTLESDHVSVFCNGTIALLVALQSMRINSGEVITTAFTFPATPHVLYWNQVQPVFCDIDPISFNIDPARVEQLITPNTRAILGVHVYGTPCDVDALDTIAHRHGLPIIYDAAHAFGVRYRGQPLVSYGDCSVLSFHATKLFTTVEGGAVVSRTPSEKKRVDYLKNFGIAGEEEVIGPGINGKMNELQAAFGLLALEGVEEEIRRRRRNAECYLSELRGIPGLSFLPEMSELERNYAYFPILVDEAAFGMSRDVLSESLRTANVFARKYFFPLCSHYSCYSGLPSASPANLPVAEWVAQRVLCLPIYGELDSATVLQICEIIRALHAEKSSGRPTGLRAHP